VGVLSATVGIDSVVGTTGSPAVVGSSVCTLAAVGSTGAVAVVREILTPLHARRAVTSTTAGRKAVAFRDIFQFISSPSPSYCSNEVKY
jgi:hypothetical protein